MLHSSHASEHRPRTSMAGYDITLTIPSNGVNATLAAQHDILRLSASTDGRLPGHMDGFSHDIGFEAQGLLDDIHESRSLANISYTPGYELSDPFSSTFEDPFSYQSGPFESLLEDNTAQQPEVSSPADPDNKLLSFGAPVHKAAVLDEQGQTWPNMSAELYGMFFVAEDVFGGENIGRPMELTCYRRNLFQISGTVMVSRSIAHVINEQAQHVPIHSLTATLSALESIEGKSTEIISVPWKSNTATTSEEKAGAAPPDCPLDLSLNPEQDPSCVSIPIAWKRLQFKHATANNGRRKGLQQHYIVQINLIATLATGEHVKLTEIRSGPIIVRGRSPRNFDSRKDVPVSERKLENKPRSSSDAAPPTPVKADPGATPSNFRFYAMNNLQQQPLDLPDWNQSTTNIPMKSPTIDSPLRPVRKSLTSPQQTRPPIPRSSWKPDSKPATATAPIDLNLADEDYGSAGRKALKRGNSADSPDLDRAKKINTGSPIENVELLYEYFPLSLDDWMPPVDAIYRPHVVHHTIIPPDIKAQQVRSKTKRYFTADE